LVERRQIEILRTPKFTARCR